MEDRAAAKSHHIRAWKVSVKEGEAPRMMSELVERDSVHGVQVLVLRAEMVFGMDHLRAAYCHAKDSIENGSSASDSIAMETLLYASGERQLSAAIKKMSVDESTRDVVVASLAADGLQPQREWTPLPEATSEATSERLLKFGISDQEARTVASGRAVELILEKVAAVDILKK